MSETIGVELNEKALLVAILKKEIRQNELKPLFRDEWAALDVLDTFNWLNLEARLAGEDKVWRQIIMPDGGLALGKTFAHSSSQYPYRHTPVTVCVRSNGVYLYRQALGRQTPPKATDVFLRVDPRHIVPECLVELFQAMVAAEITAVFRHNRRSLFRVLYRQAIDTELPTSQEGG